MVLSKNVYFGETYSKKNILQKIKEKDKFCPVSYLSDEENYFEKTRRWKKDFENDYLERFPHLKKECWPVRHKNI